MVIPIENNDLIDIYLNEIYALTKTIIRDCDMIFSSLSVPETGYLIVVDYENQNLINSIIVSTANLKKMIDPDTSRRQNETKVVYETRINRGESLSTLLNITGEEQLLNLKVRNSVEHFDEKIDMLALKKKNKNEKLYKKRAILYNMSISSRKVFNPEPYYLKAYIVEEKLAYIDNKKINLEVIKNEASILRDRVIDILKNDNPGGLLTMLN